MTVLEVFRLMAVEYSSVDDDTVQQWAELTAPLVSRKQFGKLYEQGVALLTAHRMKVAGVSGGQTGQVEESGGLQMSIADTLRVSSYSEGSTSISFSNAVLTGSADSELTLTEYGVQFMKLRSMVIIPIRCSGEVR